ncbi:glycoside hydrolase [Armillaria novae-zelandiae]|uniref:mannan endo-1,4-beta-mannosidase n=1 Tax=Armillaria novae-zelandiae TaxID=153914 RepID=A0AA39U9S1_9AGAR|nr:glycoside hydrolase [Armillaria novae-zelandiae]
MSRFLRAFLLPLLFTSQAFVGANSYWLPLLTSNEDVEATFQEMEDAGVKVLRTWGFNAINGSELSGALESGLTYYQVLERLDNVINTAGKHGIKVILAFTNNWVGYGVTGASQTHDVFYSDPRIIASYQHYVKVIVERYKNSPNIFAWELMNEARCLGDLPGGPNCIPTNFVRSLDPFHMITTGGEGQFNWDKPKHYWYDGSFVSDYNYNGEAGENFDLDLALDNIDFGTYDTPGSNFTIQQWGLGWISEHSDVLEEFGAVGIDNKTSIYPAWVDLALKTGHSIMPWQWGQLGLIEGNRVIKYADEILDGASPNDELWNIFTGAAKVQNDRSWIVG